MSPLALLYILFASSPVFNSWNTESTYPSTWNTMPFEHEYESEGRYPSSFFGYNEESTSFEPEHLNWLLRKAIRPTVNPTSIRSIIREMTGRRFFNEEPRFFNEKTESMRPIVHLISRIAKVNPILIEKILSCPETSRFVKVLRNVEPETLLLVEKMIRKNVPVSIRVKVARHVLKSLLTKSSVFGHRSILSEMYPTEESTFSTSDYETSPVEELLSTGCNVEDESATCPRKCIHECISFCKHHHRNRKDRCRCARNCIRYHCKKHHSNIEEQMMTPFEFEDNMYPTESSTFGCYESETSFFNNEYELPSFGRWNKLSKHF